MTEKKVVPLAEAPASVNFKGVTKNGWLCQWTLRDFDEGALLERQGKFIERLIEGGVVPHGKPAPIVEGNGKPDIPDEDPGWCNVHDCKMFENENERGKWWSHKTDDPTYTSGFCNGKPKK